MLKKAFYWPNVPGVQYTRAGFLVDIKKSASKTAYITRKEVKYTLLNLKYLLITGLLQVVSIAALS